MAVQAADTASVPLIDMGDTLTYHGFGAGLYPDGNQIPTSHLDSRPLPDASDDTVVLFSIGMSNTAMEFCTSGQASQDCTAESFVGQAGDDAERSASVIFVNGAQNSRPADDWVQPNSSTWDAVVEAVAAVASVEQAEICWINQANHNSQEPPTLPDENADAYDLMADLGAILRNAKMWFPNLKQCYLSSRIYAGYADRGGSIEPAAYETGFAVKWVVEAQIEQLGTGTVDARAGDLGLDVAPWIAWGPYLWAKGAEARSDGLAWLREDYRTDLIHPSPSGVQKVGALLLDFFKTSPATRGWFTGNSAPVAGFDLSCGDLSCDFTDKSTDGDGSVVSWAWDFGDGNTSSEQHPSHIYTQSGTYTVSLTVTDDGGASATDSRQLTLETNEDPSAGITLSVSGFTAPNGAKLARLSWEGATGSTVEILRDDVAVTTTDNDGLYGDRIGDDPGTRFAYRVCESGTSVCSNEATVTFD